MGQLMTRPKLLAHIRLSPSGVNAVAKLTTVSGEGMGAVAVTGDALFSTPLLLAIDPRLKTKVDSCKLQIANGRKLSVYLTYLD